MIHSHRPKLTSADGIHEYRFIEKKKLLITMAITGSMMVFEAVGGWMTNSLALMSDAGHMFTHFFALLISFLAIIFASQKISNNQTYGFYRIEILSALFNSLFLFAVTAWIVYEGIVRIIQPKPVLIVQMLFIAVVGLSVNLTSAWILHGSSKDDLNVRGAFLHMLADTISSVAIIVGALVIYFTKWYVIDPILSIFIAVVIFKWGLDLFADSINVLLEATPKGLTTDMVIDTILKEIPQVKNVKDIHIWVITSKMYSMTLHVELKQITDILQSRQVIENIKKLVDDRFDIEHATIEVLH